MSGYQLAIVWIATLILLFSSTIDATMTKNKAIEVTLWMYKTIPNREWIGNCVNEHQTTSEKLYKLFESILNETELAGLLRNASCSWNGRERALSASLVQLEFDAAGYYEINVASGNMHKKKFARWVAQGMAKQNFACRVLYIQYPIPQDVSRIILDGTMKNMSKPIEWKSMILKKNNRNENKMRKAAKFQLALATANITKIEDIKFAYFFPDINNKVHARFVLETENNGIPGTSGLERFTKRIPDMMEDVKTRSGLRLGNCSIQTFTETWDLPVTKNLPKKKNDLKITLEGYLLLHGQRVTRTMLSTWMNKISLPGPWHYVHKQVNKMRRDLGLRPYYKPAYLDRYFNKNYHSGIVVYFYADLASHLLTRHGPNGTEYKIREYLSTRLVMSGLDNADYRVTVPNIM